MAQIRAPVFRAHPATLQGGQHTEHLVAAAADAEVMNRLILQHAIGVDDEQSAQGDMLRIEIHVVRLCDGAVTVAGQGKVDLPRPPGIAA